MPFTLSNVFSGAFASLRKGFVPLMIVTLVLYLLPNQLIVLALRYGMGLTLGTAQSFQGNMLLVSMVAWLVIYFLMFVHTSAAYEICLLTTAGKPVKLGEVITHALGNAVPIFVITLLCALGWIISGVFLLVPAFIFGTIFSVVVPAYVAEKPGIFGAFSRSRALTKGHRWGIFGLWALVMVIFYVIMAAVEVPILMPMMKASMEAAQTGQQYAPPTLSLGVTLLLGVVASVLFVLILAINASAYSCLRAGKEKFSGASVEKIFE